MLADVATVNFSIAKQYFHGVHLYEIHRCGGLDEKTRHSACRHADEKIAELARQYNQQDESAYVIGVRYYSWLLAGMASGYLIDPRWTNPDAANAAARKVVNAFVDECIKTFEKPEGVTEQ